MKNKKINLIITTVLMVTVIIRFYFVFHNDNRDFLNKYSGQTVDIQGYIVDEPQIKDFNQSFTFKTVKIGDEKIKTNIRVQTERYGKYEYNDLLKITGKITLPRNFKSNGGRRFDYINYLLKDDIYFLIKNPKITILPDLDNSSLAKIITENLFKIKKDFLTNIKKVLGEPHAALAGGLVVGEKSALGEDLIDDFRKSGLIHIVVLSGYNITIVAESIRRMLSFLPRNIGLGLGGLGIVAFGILVGGGATVVRSCIMASIALLATLLRKDYNASKALFVAAILMVIENPFILLYDPSFQLSFLATLGLILLSPKIESKLTFLTEKFGIRGIVSSTFATQIFVSPYILYMMGQLSIIGIVVNILVLPIIPLTMLFVTLTGLLGFISYFLSGISGWMSHILLSYELFMVRFFAHLPFSSINLPKFSSWIVIGFYASYLVAFTKFSSIFSQFKFKKKSPI